MARVSHGKVAWPIIARPDEFQRASAALAASSALITGDAGVGKTALVEHVASAYVDEHNVTRQSIRGVAGDTRLPWATMGRHLGDLSPANGVEFGRNGEPIGLLHIDDAHLLDDMSAQYASWLVRTTGAAFIATTRSFQKLPKPLQLLIKDAGAEQIMIGPLTREQTSAALVRALGGTVDATLARRIWRHTGGNPLFLRELVRSGLRSKALHESVSGWQWTGKLTAGKYLHDFLGGELDAMPDGVRTVIELAALGEPMPRSSLLQLVDSADYDAAFQSGLVALETTEPAGITRVRPSHPLIGEIVREIVPPATRVELYRRANRYRSRPTHSDTPTARLRAATWALECGIDPGFETLVSAALAAIQLHDVDACLAMTDAALAGKNITGPLQLRAMTIRAYALRFVDDQAESRREIEKAWRLAQTPAVRAELLQNGPTRLARGLVELRAGVAQYLDDDPPGAQTVVSEGRTILTDKDADMLSLAMSGWAADWATFMPGVDALLAAHGNKPPPEMFRLIAPYAFGLSAGGRTTAALKLCGWSVEMARTNSETEPWAVGELRSAQHRAALLAGDVDSAARWVADDIAEDLPFMKFENDANAIGWAEIAIARGRWSDAAADLQAATEQMERNDHEGLKAYAWAKRAHAEEVIGAPSAKRTLARAQREGLRGVRVVEDEIRLTLLCARVVGGDAGGADVDELIAWARREEMISAELDALHVRYLIDTRDRRKVVDRMRKIARRVDGERAELLLAHVEALQAGDDARTRRVVRKLEAHGTWVHARMPRPPLTPREHEIAALAASGLPNKSIADRLHVSVRTVDSHMSRVLSKLNLAGRDELARLYIG